MMLRDLLVHRVFFYTPAIINFVAKWLNLTLADKSPTKVVSDVHSLNETLCCLHQHNKLRVIHVLTAQNSRPKNNC